MDLDGFDAPAKAPSRVSKFAPKTSRLIKPKSEPAPKPEPEPEPKPEPDETVKMDVEVTAAEDEPPPPPPQDDPMDEDTAAEEDEVVREIDVFFTPSIDAETELYVFQYPLRPSWRPYELDERCQEVTLRTSKQKGLLGVEVDLSVDVHSNNIDRDFADKVKFTKQTLHTSWIPPSANGCAVGLLIGDKLHLHPIHAIVQLRPSLKHLNSGGSETKKIISTGANATVKVEGSNEEKSAATSKKQKKQMEPSIEQKSDDDDEHFVPLKYHGSKSDISSRYLQQMVAQESSPINFSMSAYDYVTALCPGVNKPKGPSKRYLLTLPVEERLKKMFIEGPPLRRFNAIKHFAPEYSDEELLEFLQQHAFLLWGLWTPRSEFIFSVIGPECLARDHVLILFSKNLTVRSSDVNANWRGDFGIYLKKFLRIFGLERHDANKTMSQPMPYWKFREVPDESFKKLYPDVVKKQEERLMGLEQHASSALAKAIKPKLGKSAMTNHSRNSELVKSANSVPRVASLGGVPPGNMTMSNETRHALPIALKKLFQTHKVCSFQFIREELRKMAVSKTTLSKGDSKIAVDAARSLDGPEHELKAVISDVACDIHGYYALKSSQEDPFRDVVIDMLRGSGPNAKLKKAEIQEAARRKLRREINNNEYNKVMSELCVSKGSVWVLKSGDGSMQ